MEIAAAVMALGRFVPMLATLALAGSLAAQQKVPETAGTLPTTGPLFGALLTGTIVLVAALTFIRLIARPCGGTGMTLSRNGLRRGAWHGSSARASWRSVQPAQLLISLPRRSQAESATSSVIR